jgi:hypothetical protein
VATHHCRRVTEPVPVTSTPFCTISISGNIHTTRSSPPASSPVPFRPWSCHTSFCHAVLLQGSWWCWPDSHIRRLQCSTGTHRDKQASASVRHSYVLEFNPALWGLWWLLKRRWQVGKPCRAGVLDECHDDEHVWVGGGGGK